MANKATTEKWINMEKQINPVEYAKILMWQGEEIIKDNLQFAKQH